MVSCYCSQPAVRFQVQKEGPNKGKYFFTCQTKKCKFFQWDNNRAATSQVAPPKGSVQVEVTFSMHSDGEVTIKFFNEKIKGWLKEQAAVQWNGKDWTIPYEMYDVLAENLSQLEIPGLSIKINELPAWVLRIASDKKQHGISLHQKYMTPEQMKFRDETFLEKQVTSKIAPELWGKLMPFQRQGIKQIVKKGGKVLLADEMGLGKSLQSITTLSYYQEWPCLIICPSSLRLTWKSELKRWLDFPDDDIQVIFQGKDKIDSHVKVVIISYDLAQKKEILDQIYNEAEKSTRYKFIICDESHFLKSPEAQRTKKLLPVIKATSKSLLLSGTPSLSRPIELFTQLNALRPDLFRSLISYGTRYADGKQGFYGMDFTGSSNLEELNWILTNTVLLRRLKKDVLTQLPEKTRQCIMVDISSTHKKEIKKLMESEKELAARMVLLSGPGMSEAENEKKSQLMQLWKLTGTSKIPAVIDYLTEIFKNSEKKFIVFAHHQDVLNGIQEGLDKLKASYIRIDGNTPQQDRQGLCEKFQNKDIIRAAILGITAAGVGLTLSAADLVIFAELYWNPAQLLQCEDRAHRIGRRDNVDVKYILADGTVDDIQWPLVKKKMSVVGQSLDGKGGTMAVTVALDATQKTRDLEHQRKALDDWLIKEPESARNSTESSSQNGSKSSSEKEIEFIDLDDAILEECPPMKKFKSG